MKQSQTGVVVVCGGPSWLSGDPNRRCSWDIILRIRMARPGVGCGRVGKSPTARTSEPGFMEEDRFDLEFSWGIFLQGPQITTAKGNSLRLQVADLVFDRVRKHDFQSTVFGFLGL
jgi:hypothetical protein